MNANSGPRNTRNKRKEEGQENSCTYEWTRINTNFHGEDGRGILNAKTQHGRAATKMNLNAKTRRSEGAKKKTK